MKNRLAARVIAGTILMGLVLGTVAMPRTVMAEENQEETEETQEETQETPSEEQQEETQQEAPRMLASQPETPQAIARLSGCIAESSISAGNTTTASVSISSSNISDTENLRVEWNSQNSSVASISGSGNVVTIKGNSAGTCGITASLYYNGQVMDACFLQVNVTAAPAPQVVTVQTPAAQSSKVSVTGISVSTTYVELAKEGDTTTVSAYVSPSNADNMKVHWCSDNPSVASVDNGYIRAYKNGTATIIARTDDGNYSAYVTVKVGNGNNTVTTQPTVTSDTSVVDPAVNAEAVNKISAAKKNGTVTIKSATAKSFDMNVAVAMATRKDVKVECVFPFNGHIFKLTIPKGYALANTMNAAGYVTWLDLCKLNGIGGISVIMLQ